MTKLHDLYSQGGQSPWLDNIKRSYLTGGELARLVSEGIRGVTSNPTIFAKAIEDSSDYDEQFTQLIRSKTVEESYWVMAIDDITGALDVLRPVYDSCDGGDGFVSIEVGPHLAYDTEGTISEARELHQRIGRPNLLVKIPATAEGLPAITTMISEGVSINVTLIFSLKRYEEVIEAYLTGLEKLVESGAGPERVSRVASVASFFISRVDTEVDRRLEGLASQGNEEVLELAGSAAVSQAKLAYQIFTERFSGPRWDALAAKGARVQRPLWASTSTKNPAYPDLKYVDTLIGPDTVNTMPDQTVAAVLDHGIISRSVSESVDDSRQALARLSQAGIDIDDVTKLLEDEGVASFTKSFDEMMQALSDKAGQLR
ncbi:MAG TPA: transaldolase [Acidimicrobiales bacterium]|nr:transaldolase [Acidimicrobiales bacterium]